VIEMPKLKCWKKIGENRWKQQKTDGREIEIADFKYKDKTYYAIRAFNPNGLDEFLGNISKKTEAKSIANKYMKEHDRC